MGNNRAAWPGQRGFQHYYGIHNYVDSYFKVLENCEVFDDGRMVIPASKYPSSDTTSAHEWYTTDVFTDKAIQYMDDALDQGKPFFQYVATTSNSPLRYYKKYQRRLISSDQ